MNWSERLRTELCARATAYARESGVPAYGLGASPEFGIAGRVPLANGGTDTTEVDMQIGDVIVEAKLTESDFTSRPKSVVEGYRGFAEVFETRVLPRSETKFHGYQLIRNVLCAAEYGHPFTLMCDARRPDLIREWWLVMRAIREVAFRSRCRGGGHASRALPTHSGG